MGYPVAEQPTLRTLCKNKSTGRPASESPKMTSSYVVRSLLSHPFRLFNLAARKKLMLLILIKSKLDSSTYNSLQMYA